MPVSNFLRELFYSTHTHPHLPASRHIGAYSCPFFLAVKGAMGIRSAWKAYSSFFQVHAVPEGQVSRLPVCSWWLRWWPSLAAAMA